MPNKVQNYYVAYISKNNFVWFRRWRYKV